MILDAEIKLKGIYSYKVTDRSGNVKKSGLIENALLDRFFVYLRSNASPCSVAYLKLGTGSTPVANNQTNLANVLSSIPQWPGNTNIQYNNMAVDGSNIKGSIVYTWLFPLGAIVGNISEVGVDFENPETGVVHSRALITDGSTPTTIPVTDEDQLSFSYNLNVQAPIADNVANVTGVFNGVNNTISVRSRWGMLDNPIYYLFSNMGAEGIGYVYDGDLNPVGEFPSGNTSFAQTTIPTNQFNVSNSKRRTYIFETNEGNFAGGINVFTPSGFSIIKFGFTPAIPKTASQRFTITVQQTFSRL